MEEGIHTMKKITILIMISFLCSGCLQKYPIEQLGIITAVGFDPMEEDKLHGTLVMFQFDPTVSHSSYTVESEAHTLKGIRYEANQKTSHKLVSGQVRLEVYQDKLAEKGLTQYLDTVTRDAKMSPMAYLSVSDVPTKDLLKSEISEDAPNIGKYTQRLIEKSIKSEMIPDATVVAFMREIHDTGIDPVLPLLSLSQGKVVINGLALFHDDRYVGTLEKDEIFYLKILRRKMKIGELQIKLPSDSMEKYYKNRGIDNETDGSLYVSLHNVKSDVKIEPKKNDPTSYSVTLNMENRLLELSKSIDLKDKKAIKALEKQMEIKIEKKLNALLDKLKEKQIDPVGFGQKYNTQHRKNRVTQENWREQIPKLNVDFEVQVKLLRHGISE